MDASASHCEQSWEDDASGQSLIQPASPDTGLKWMNSQFKSDSSS